MPPLQRSFWSVLLAAAAVLVPVALLGTGAAILVFRIPATTALAGAALFSGVAGMAVAVSAWVVARRLARSLEAADEVLSRIAAGDFGGRIPIESRYLIEQVAQATDRAQEYLRAHFAELQASRDQLRTVLNSMVEGVIAVDDAQRVLLVNDSACRLFRIAEASCLGRPLWELVRSPPLQQCVAEALHNGEPAGCELELLAPISKVVSIRVASLPGGASRGAIVVASDMSQLRRLEGIRREFVANASHELKTPLASIKACVETLLDGALEDSEIRVRFLQTINEQTERLDKLIRDLLSLTRIESEGMKTDLHPVALEGIVTICHERHRQSAERKGMRLLTEPPPEPMRVLGDEEALEQILDNLIDNAIKYTNDGGTVTIRWRHQDDGCVVDVEDTGIGIPQSHLPRIFERFYRVDRARSRELGGTGLGLSIVRHLVQALGGQVSVSSRLGKGSLFSVHLQVPNSIGAPTPATPAS